MAMPDEIGNRAQSIAYLRLSDPAGEAGPYFRPEFLGDKCPTLDYYVELVGAGTPVPFFFVQVKGSRSGCVRGQGPPRLKVRIPPEDVRRMDSHPAPIYVLGVDEVNEEAYILAVEGGMDRAISWIPTTHLLDETNRRLLWEEVQGYWKDYDLARKVSRFVREGQDRG
jgi:hypothetical protein